MKIFDIESNECKKSLDKFITEKSNFINEFRSKYDFIIGYHGTNLIEKEVNSIKKNGLKKSSIDLLQSKAIKRFLNIDIEINKTELNKTITDYDKNFELNPIGKIYFGLKREYLLIHYHYILFGSESLLEIADFLKSKYQINFRKHLIDSGKHYIIKTLLPVKEVGDEEIKLILDYYINEDFPISIVLYTDINSEYIVEIEEVEKPLDKFNYIDI